MNRFGAFIGVLALPLLGVGGFYGPDVYAAFTARSSAQAYVSVADKYCADLWVENARNDPALVCYLTTKPDRLCQPDEKKHLVGLIDRYLEDQQRMGEQLGLSLTNVRAQVSSHPEMEPEKTMAAATAKEGKRLKSEGMDKAWNLRTVKDEELTELLAKLVKRGLLQDVDFDYAGPPFVRAAFEGNVANPSVCSRSEL